MPIRVSMLDLTPSVSLRDHTTLRIGGNAVWFAEPSSASDVGEAFVFAKEHSLPALVIGKGSNLLVSDSGWPGIVIAISDRFSGIDWNDCEAVAGAGCMLDRLVRESVERGCGGIEELSGIPGTVGGAVVMNAGAFSTAIAATIVSAEYVDAASGSIVIATREELALGYRSSALQGREVIVISARFRFGSAEAAVLREKRREILDKRREKQPLDLPNCGSVFKRPPGMFAGTLIEQAGLRGFRYGNASISGKHANFIVNHGNATAAEVRHLIVVAQTEVYKRSGVLLEPEVIFAGTFDEPLFSPFRPAREP